MAVAKKMLQFMESGSWIRKMFEEGARLKKIHGDENVFDFSLGNPNVPPPEVVKQKLLEIVNRDEPNLHGYMPNAGLLQTRAAVSSYLCGEYGVPMEPQHLVVTCGAAGALNIVLKSLLDPGDEVITPAPYFVEYSFYADNHGGTLKAVPTLEDFTLDLDGMEKAIGPRTKIILINSPNNPTGQIYTDASLQKLGEILSRKSKEYGHSIYLVSDEPYRKIVYNGTEVPCIFKFYTDSLIATSYSKDLSLPGERIGFVAVCPQADGVAKIVDALSLANRILGFVNAPGLMQRLISELQGICVDVDIYKRKRDILANGLIESGYTLTVPHGAFYLFPKSPLKDDIQFVRLLQEENILVVPGSGFGGPGHFRIAYCVDDHTIEKSLPGFRRAFERAQGAA
ncbi:pyridoxal phosphate-dependent aminotransferase [Desulforhabdus amnigena]|uniref:Aminotransferase n=1 Tax=Desulforhabdus amnigena TaxID=40218 RepID=A0A9W6FQU6_9BACT|nr:pyridoxal phosphate-dependent aminotransferase [Desulforhabdus amnigena]NLJ29162.1 pyridoxal phosphate-dependent aminotransferase [Deltaproteobacteria bacterium]GLI32852.1 aspartate aminotransferase [Desulforhabdus amnigena]